jgi:glucose-1-phosphatase
LTDTYSVIVFDMGGVLYDFQGDRLIARTSRRARRWRSDEVQEHWPELALGFETGKASDIEFAEAVVKRYDLTLTSAEFLVEFRSAAIGFYDGALELVMDLRERHRVLSLSNTNPAQWSKVLADLGATDPFHSHHPSHVIGFHKPDLRAFHAVSAQIASAGTCHFFDDRADNVDAAQRFGWRAQRCARRHRGTRRVPASRPTLTPTLPKDADRARAARSPGACSRAQSRGRPALANSRRSD